MKKRIVILGAGESGVGAAILALKEGFEVFVSDSGKIKEEYKETLKKYRIEFEEEKHTEKIILNASEIIISPGIPDTVQIVKKVINKNINIISEIEFASRYTDAKKICITGSNGKTTTTMLIFHILQNAGLNVALAGNVGKSFALQVAQGDFEYFVLELSSFQLDKMYEFKAEIAVLLNITPDHLDRYDYNFNKYIDSKFRITQNQTKDDKFIYCGDDEVILKELDKRDIDAELYPFSVKNIYKTGAYISESIINIKTKEQIFTMKNNELSLKGTHNTYNSMAAGITAKLNNIRNKALKDKLADFKSVPHRLEKYIKVKGIQFINDSKATNVNSTWYALHSINTKVILIIGGVDKGNDYSILKDLVNKKVKAIVCLGVDNSGINEAFIGMTEIYDTDSMDKAVRKAFKIADEGDTVLLSPACASFDLFKNFEDRGEKFKLAVREL